MLIERQWSADDNRHSMQAFLPRRVVSWRQNAGRNAGVNLGGLFWNASGKEARDQVGDGRSRVDSPCDYSVLLNPLPENVVISSTAAKELDLVHIFTKSRSELLQALVTYQKRIKQNGIIWVSWPKKASGIPSEVSEDTVRDIALPLGLVDVKVCAVDDTWSGLKLVIRKQLRK